MPQHYIQLNSAILCLFMLTSTGCTLKASTESVTDATTNFLSSTTPGAWFTLDGLLKPSERLNAFVVTNYENLEQDMAKGEGEYLTALGTLINIPTEQLPEFKMHAQGRFQQIDQTTQANLEDFLLALLPHH